jgi:hypothetical protein
MRSTERFIKVSSKINQNEDKEKTEYQGKVK